MPRTARSATPHEREFFIDNLLVRVHFIIVMIRWTGLASREFEFPLSGSLTPTFLRRAVMLARAEDPSGVRYVYIHIYIYIYIYIYVM